MPSEFFPPGLSVLRSPHRIFLPILAVGAGKRGFFLVAHHCSAYDAHTRLRGRVLRTENIYHPQKLRMSTIRDSPGREIVRLNNQRPAWGGRPPWFLRPLLPGVQARSDDFAVIPAVSEHGAYSEVWPSKRTPIFEPQRKSGFGQWHPDRGTKPIGEARCVDDRDRKGI